MEPHHMWRMLAHLAAQGGRDPFSRMRGGPWGQRGGRARRGDVRAAILTVLSEKPMNGYQIMQALEEKSRGTWRPSPGAVYPALAQLEDEGLIKADEIGGGRVFKLTPEGEKFVNAHKEVGASPWEPPPFDHDHDDDGLALAKLIPEIVPAIVQLGQNGTPKQVSAAKKVLKEAKRALYRILAEDEDDTDDR